MSGSRKNLICCRVLQVLQLYFLSYNFTIVKTDLSIDVNVSKTKVSGCVGEQAGSRGAAAGGHVISVVSDRLLKGCGWLVISKVNGQ